MKLYLDYEIYHWLISLKVLKPSVQHKLNKSGKYTIDENNTVLFQNGKRFLDLALTLSFIVSQKSSEILKEEWNLKSGYTNSIKQQNWEVLTNVYRLFGISIQKGIKNLLIGGDNQMINEILNEIYKKTSSFLEQLSDLKVEENLVYFFLMNLFNV